MRSRPIAAGTTLLAFLAAGALADVTGMSVNYRTTVDPLLEYDEFFDSTVIGNENFDITGGPELLTFSDSANGGDVFQSLEWGQAIVSATGVLTADGGFEHDITVRGNAGGFFDTPDSVTAGMSSTVEFTIDSVMDFELMLLEFNFDNDAGFGSIGFVNTGTNEDLIDDFFFPGQFSPHNPGVYTGTIDPGTYRLSASTNYGESQYAFTLVPSPSSLALLGLGGLCVTRRRR